MTELEIMGKNAKEAARSLATAGTEKKDEALRAIARCFLENMDKIIKANKVDLEEADRLTLSSAIVDRLTLNEKRIKAMAQGILEIAALPDPIGSIIGGGKRPNGMEIKKVRVPLGVIGIIYEARPNVTADSAALCLKSGNVVILRGGKEAFHSNACISELMRNTLYDLNMDPNCIQLVRDITHASAIEMMNMTGYLDVLIPRGGANLIRSVVENAHVPVIQTGAGNCHIFVDESADLEMAIDIIENAKVSRPSVCNAVETVLVHRNIAEKFLPLLKKRLDKSNVRIKGCARTCAFLKMEVERAVEKDWEKEYLDYILAIKVVSSFDEAINHIDKYSTGHSESIITSDYEKARRFTEEIDSAAVYVNASTRFTDGGEFGNGAEIGISTQKLHARGPMGINELTTYKYIIYGNGQIRE
ncbi:MAG: glutamate-5-semialdehyde dehydrogenase [Acutalibacteraceae bacterium]